MVNTQDPSRTWNLLEEHVANVAPVLAPGCKVEMVRIGEGSPAYISNRTSIGTRLAGEVLDEIYGTSHVLAREGGSVPITGMLQQMMQLETVFLAFGINDARNHAPNERYRVKSFYQGQEAYVRMILKLAYAMGDPTTMTGGSHIEL